MPMTQRDFEAIADAVQEAKRRVAYYESQSNDDSAFVALEFVTQELATACARQYRGAYGFKRQKFVDACGFPEA